jgi:hypothetical protein
VLATYDLILWRGLAQLDVADGQALRPLPFRDKPDLKVGIKLSESVYQFPYCHGRQRNIVMACAEDCPGPQVCRWRRMRRRSAARLLSRARQASRRAMHGTLHLMRWLAPCVLPLTPVV